MECGKFPMKLIVLLIMTIVYTVVLGGAEVKHCVLYLNDGGRTIELSNMSIGG